MLDNDLPFPGAKKQQATERAAALHGRSAPSSWDINKSSPWCRETVDAVPTWQSANNQLLVIGV